MSTRARFALALAGLVAAGCGDDDGAGGADAAPPDAAAVADAGVERYTLFVAPEGDGEGTVTSAPAGIDCPDACEAQWDEGEVVILTATAGEGSTFVEWTGDCFNQDCELTMDADKAVGARFEIPFACNDDSAIEPNDTTEQATITPIPELASSYELVGLAICPADEFDLFRFGVDTNGVTVTVDVSFYPRPSALQLHILNADGTPVANGSLAEPGVKRAELPNAPVGTYYVQVNAFQGAVAEENNYDLSITTTPP